MELKEIKKIARLARAAGIKGIKIDGLELEFHEPRSLGPKRVRLQKGIVDSGSGISKEEPAPTLEQINDYIYGQAEELG